MRASTVSRMATTVAERGAPVYRLISPVISPRPSSRTMRALPSGWVTYTRSRPLRER